MHGKNHALLHSKDVIHRMRAPYPAAYVIKRYTYRSWAIDVVTYDKDTWVAYIFGPGIDGKRLAPFASVLSALQVSKQAIDELIVRALTEPPKEKKPRTTKRYKRKSKPKEVA